MALMGRDSLRSDLEVSRDSKNSYLTETEFVFVPFQSLERMVVDFARDEYHLSGSELDVLAEKVRSGDLTTVLKAWEQDIKVSSLSLSRTIFRNLFSPRPFTLSLLFARQSEDH